MAIESVLPRGDDMIRKSREAYWMINEYESTIFGNNRLDWNVIRFANCKVFKKNSLLLIAILSLENVSA